MKTHENEPIHPMTKQEHDNIFFWGLTKREYFAAMALQGIIASCPESYPDREPTAIRALEYADALIKQLNKGN